MSSKTKIERIEELEKRVEDLERALSEALEHVAWRED